MGIKTHNREAKRKDGVRVVACFLPVKSPWLNPIEPKWAFGKKAIVEPERLFATNEVRTRVCDRHGCEHLKFLIYIYMYIFNLSEMCETRRTPGLPHYISL